MIRYRYQLFEQNIADQRAFSAVRIRAIAAADSLRWILTPLLFRGFFLAVAAQNIKRLVRFLSSPTAPEVSPLREKQSVALPYRKKILPPLSF